MHRGQTYDLLPVFRSGDSSDIEAYDLAAAADDPLPMEFSEAFGGVWLPMGAEADWQHRSETGYDLELQGAPASGFDGLAGLFAKLRQGDGVASISMVPGGVLAGMVYHGKNGMRTLTTPSLPEKSLDEYLSDPSGLPILRRTGQAAEYARDAEERLAAIEV